MSPMEVGWPLRLPLPRCAALCLFPHSPVTCVLMAAAGMGEEGAWKGREERSVGGWIVESDGQTGRAAAGRERNAESRWTTVLVHTHMQHKIDHI